MNEKKFCQVILVDWLMANLPGTTLGQLAGRVLNEALDVEDEEDEKASDIAWQAIEDWMED